MIKKPAKPTLGDWEKLTAVEAKIFGKLNIPEDMYIAAMRDLYKYYDNRQLKRVDLLTLIDFRLPRTTRRLWVVNRGEKRVLYHEYVAHGSGSGPGNRPEHFSNIEGSKMSSLGAFVTLDNLKIRNVGGIAGGPVLEVNGLEPLFNSAALDRYIFFHGATYVTSGSSGGRAMDSSGCFATADHVNRKLIKDIKGGSLVYSYNGCAVPFVRMSPSPEEDMSRIIADMRKKSLPKSPD